MMEDRFQKIATVIFSLLLTLFIILLIHEILTEDNLYLVIIIDWLGGQYHKITRLFSKYL